MANKGLRIGSGIGVPTVVPGIPSATKAGTLPVRNIPAQAFTYTIELWWSTNIPTSWVNAQLVGSTPAQSFTNLAFAAGEQKQLAVSVQCPGAEGTYYLIAKVTSGATVFTPAHVGSVNVALGPAIEIGEVTWSS